MPTEWLADNLVIKERSETSQSSRECDGQKNFGRVQYTDKATGRRGLGDTRTNQREDMEDRRME